MGGVVLDRGCHGRGVDSGDVPKVENQRIRSHYNEVLI